MYVARVKTLVFVGDSYPKGDAVFTKVGIPISFWLDAGLRSGRLDVGNEG